MTEPRGILAIVTDKHGSVVASKSDFAPDTPGGCEPWFGQLHRVQLSAKIAAICAYCSPVVTDALDAYMLEQIFDRMRHRTGHRVTIKAIGWGDDVQHELDKRSA